MLPFPLRRARKYVIHRVMLGCGVVFLAATASSSGRGSALPTSMQEVVLAARSREHGLCKTSFVEWQVTERVGPSVVERINKRLKKKVPSTSNDEIEMHRAHKLVMRENEWRFDRQGEHLFSTGSDPVSVTRLDNIFLHRDGRDERFTIIDGKISKESSGQFRAATRALPPVFNDIQQVPTTLYARPSLVGFFQQIVAGEFEAFEDQQTGQNLIGLVDKKTRTQRVWFDKTHDFVPVRLSFGGKDVRIDYAIYPEFGYAPSAWNVVKVDKNGQVDSVSSARDVKWGKDLTIIEELLSFKYPVHADVVDLDSHKVFTATPSGELVAKVHVPVRSVWRIVLILANVAVCLFLVAYILWRRRYNREQRSA